MNPTLIHPRRPRPALAGIGGAVIWMGAVAAASLAGSPSAVIAGQAEPSDAARLLAVLIDPQATAAARDSAADELVLLAQRPDVSKALAAVLRDDPDTGRARPILLTAVARAWEPPARLFRPIADTLAARSSQAPPDPDVAQFIGALGAFRTREAAELLTKRLDAQSAPAERQAAAAALLRMTGRDDLGDDPALWAAWLEQAKSLSNQQWDDLLSQGVWRRAQRTDADRRALAATLVEGYRRLYLALPAAPGEERAKLLVQMLLGPRPELLDLGVEIVSREVAAGKAVEPSIVEAAIKLLGAPDAEVRGHAVALVMQLAPTGAGVPIGQALEKEADAGVAAALLTAAARWPLAPMTGPALRWLKAGAPTAGPAIDCLQALRAAGQLTDPADQEIVLAALRAESPDQITPAGCHLLASLGNAQDRDPVAALLEQDQAGLRLAAADAIADRPEHLDRILVAAHRDAGLFSIAVRAVSENRPTADGYARAAGLPSPSPAEYRAGMLRLSSGLSVSDLVRIAQRDDVDAAMRDSMLSRLAEQGPAAGQSPEDRTALVEGLELLAQTRLAMKRPDLAVDALDALPSSPEGIDSGKLRALRTVALLWANQIDRAAEVGAPPDAWIDGLERAIGEPHARSILREVRTRFGRALTPEQADRVNRLAARLVAGDLGPEILPTDHAAAAADDGAHSK